MKKKRKWIPVYGLNPAIEMPRVSGIRKSALAFSKRTSKEDFQTLWNPESSVAQSLHSSVSESFALKRLQRSEIALLTNLQPFRIV